MKEITELIRECYDRFAETEDYRILKAYRSRDNRLTFDERFSINKSIERAYAPLFEQLRADAPSLTESDLFYCALTFQHIETVAIAECLTVTKDAIRMRKLRLREKLPTQWTDILFPEQKRNATDAPEQKRNSSQSVTSQTVQGPTDPVTLRQQQNQNATVMKQKMTFTQAIETAFRKMFDYSGRASRAEFWYYFLFMSVIKATVMIIANLVKSTSYEIGRVDTYSPLMIFILSLMLLIYIGTSVLHYLSVCVRRLHDLNEGLLLFFTIMLIPDVTFNIAQTVKSHLAMPSSSASTLMGLIAIYYLISAIIMFVLFAKPGTEGPNQYGPDPLTENPDNRKTNDR